MLECSRIRYTGKLEQLAGEMKRYRLSILAVTETHLPGEGEMLLDAETSYKLLFSGIRGQQCGRSRNCSFPSCKGCSATLPAVSLGY